jgi:hypothetical protein
VGKPGYVYQAANFMYGGFIWTDVYISPEGEKIHPRTARHLCIENGIQLGREKVFWLTPAFMKEKGIRRIKGKQFRYIMPLNKQLRKSLNKDSTVEWTRDYPKHADLVWKEQIGPATYVDLDSIPDFDLNISNINAKNINAHKTNSIF